MISRFIFFNSHCSRNKNRLNPQSFFPPKKSPNEISVYDIHGLNDDTVWEIGNKFVASKRKKEIVARGDMLVSDVNSIKNENNGNYLYVERDKSIHYLHANIKNIHTRDGEKKIIAMKLALATKDKIFFP